mgnify:CR=1 FL=1
MIILGLIPQYWDLISILVLISVFFQGLSQLENITKSVGIEMTLHSYS